MADAIDKTTDAAGTAEEVDTTDNDGFDAESALENADESFDSEDEDGNDADESTEDEAATDSEEETDADSEDAVEDEATDEQSDEAEDLPKDATEEDTAKVAAEAERKRYNDEMAKARIEAKRAREEAEAVRKQAEESNIERYLKEAEGDADELKARELDVREYRLKEQTINLNTQSLQTDVNRAFGDIELFKTGTPAVKERLLRALDLFERTSITKDERGRPVEVKGDVYKYLQDEAAAIVAEREELRAEVLGTQNKAKTNQKSRTLATPSKTPVKPKVDADLAAFDEYANSDW